jgi:hypothetical protein
MMNAFWASENFDDFIAFRSSQLEKLAPNCPVQNEGLFREWITHLNEGPRGAQTKTHEAVRLLSPHI